MLDRKPPGFLKKKNEKKKKESRRDGIMEVVR
jgi:hypothetical protein